MIFAGLRVAMGASWMGLVAAELMGASRGVGYMISTAWMAVLAAEMVATTEGVGWIITAGQQSADMTQVFVGIVAIALTGLALAAILRFAERVVCS